MKPDLLTDSDPDHGRKTWLFGKEYIWLRHADDLGRPTGNLYLSRVEADGE